MKKINKVILGTIAWAAIITLSSWTSLAMYWNGWGQWNWFGKTLSQEQRAEMQSMSQEERQEYMQKLKEENWYKWKGKWQWNWKSKSNWKWAKQSWHNHSPADLLKWVALQDLSDEEKEMLYYGYSEELLAHDMYMHFYDLYGVETFKNIANSEYQHMNAVKTLLERYDLEIPSDYGELSDEFDVLKAEGEEGLQKALEVWVKIEILDIDDIADTIKTSDNDDFKIIFTNIWWASFNHLRGFLNWLKNNGLSTDIDYSNYLSEDEVNTKWGALKTKMAEKVQAEWVDLPKQASPEYIKETCDKEETNKNKWQNRSSEVNKGKQWEKKSNYNSSIKDEYKKKYSTVVSQMSDEKLETLLEKIDILLEKINTWNYSENTKSKYNSILFALKELAIENIDEEELGTW